MTRTERTLLGATAGVALLAAGYATPARAEIPVIDTAALGEWIVSLADDAKAYALQLQQYLTQMKQYVGEELSWVTQASQYATQLQQYANELQMFVNFVHNPSLGTAMALLSAAASATACRSTLMRSWALWTALSMARAGCRKSAGYWARCRAWSAGHIRPRTSTPRRMEAGQVGAHCAGQRHRW